MVMSRNSLDSKISRHSRHSTNSASSSRETICTRGCLQGCISFFFTGEDGGIEFITPIRSYFAERPWESQPEIGRILARPQWLSSPRLGTSVHFRVRSRRNPVTDCHVKCQLFRIPD